MMILFAIISFIGFVDAFYLTVEHFLGTIPECSVLAGCETVLTSQYSVVLGVPVALMGAVYYLVLVLLTIWYLDKPQERKLRLIAQITWLGLLATIWFVFLQGVVLKALCLYCLVSAVTSTILFLMGRLIERRLNDKTHI